jgi:hypothetical protein
MAVRTRASLTKKNMRFTLRSLFIGIALFAIVLSCWLGYRRATHCQLRWLSPGSAEAKTLFSAPAIQHLDDGSYRLTYYSRSRDVQDLLRMSQPTGDYNVRVDGQSIVVKSPDLTLIQLYLQSLQTADKRQPGTFVIRGRVVDRSGQPVAHATIDVMGNFASINSFQTRDDGTFAMPLDDAGAMSAPAGSGYYLRVRIDGASAAKGMRWETASFSLSPEIPERDAVIVIPRTLESEENNS